MAGGSGRGRDNPTTAGRAYRLGWCHRTRQCGPCPRRTATRGIDDHDRPTTAGSRLVDLVDLADPAYLTDPSDLAVDLADPVDRDDRDSRG
ncbi:hypothetical protein MXD59_13775 [Frankia sp. Ag45/Mut15]|uniref:Uncharacterized protein n=1 Tax=Frankia umida TaxID=573489 RepID=A0ABT0JZ67_9ACTN|nr:hypothetical protein [Frankia umida]MCK9876836.1 hypothetical protein [Frankia umida]